MREFKWFEDRCGKYVGTEWTCYNCGYLMFVEDVMLEENESTFVTCPECHGRGVYVGGEK